MNARSAGVLLVLLAALGGGALLLQQQGQWRRSAGVAALGHPLLKKIGRASCRERVCNDV